MKTIWKNKNVSINHGNRIKIPELSFQANRELSYDKRMKNVKWRNKINSARQTGYSCAK